MEKLTIYLLIILILPFMACKQDYRLFGDEIAEFIPKQVRAFPKDSMYLVRLDIYDGAASYIEIFDNNGLLISSHLRFGVACRYYDRENGGWVPNPIYFEKRISDKPKKRTKHYVNNN